MQRVLSYRYANYQLCFSYSNTWSFSQRKKVSNLFPTQVDQLAQGIHLTQVTINTG